ncbi:MAG: isoprenoid biosynthesis glyoxalase ElbB [Planctomycetes bacterium]|nr:isoprenoid biosynthesis glyoxalase ElbB [Planctomycetota bacterium]
MKKRVGVVLSGCGFLDGSEIHEATLTLLHLDRAGASSICMAPRRPLADVVDHETKRSVAGESRDVLREAARIARGAIKDLASVEPGTLDALILPGGYGAAKNLCTFARDGADAKVEPEIARLIRAMHEARKPIGVICIAPAVLAAVFRGTPVRPTVTVGDDTVTGRALAAMGAEVVVTPVTGIAIDERNRFVSTPAYMYDARIADVSIGIEKLVAAVLSLA